MCYNMFKMTDCSVMSSGDSKIHHCLLLYVSNTKDLFSPTKKAARVKV
jgi:hypothetical protein